MMIYPEIDERRNFGWSELHKKIGQIINLEPTDSDIQEGNTKTQIFLVDEKGVWWLLREFDTTATYPDESELTKLRARVALLEEALGFYAKGGNFNTDVWKHETLGYFTGLRAREALSESAKIAGV